MRYLNDGNFTPLPKQFKRIVSYLSLSLGEFLFIPTRSSCVLIVSLILIPIQGASAFSKATTSNGSWMMKMEWGRFSSEGKVHSDVPILRKGKPKGQSLIIVTIVHASFPILEMNHPETSLLSKILSFNREEHNVLCEYYKYSARERAKKSREKLEQDYLAITQVFH